MTTQTNVPHLLSPFSLQDLSLKNRVVMAPLTRSRAGSDRIPNALMAEYYAQRAGCGINYYRSYYYLRTGEWLATYPWCLYHSTDGSMETGSRCSTR